MPNICVNCIVFSTYVEVIPRVAVFLSALIGFLHVCGGDPIRQIFNVRNCSFSTYVEVILIVCYGSPNMVRFLHVCGGDPRAIDALRIKNVFSPRMWR